MRAPTSLTPFFRLCAQVAGVLFLIYVGVLTSFTWQTSYLSQPAVVIRILYGALVFSIGFALFSRRVRPRDLVPGSRVSPRRHALQLIVAFSAGCALCGFITVARDWWPVRIGMFQQTILAMKEMTIPMGGIWMVHSLGEELFFRAFIYQELKALFRPALAVLLASLFFAFAHLDVSGIPRNIAISLVVIGCYEKTGNIYAAVAAHTALNTCAQYVIYNLREGWNAPYGGLVAAFAASVGLPLLLQVVAKGPARRQAETD